MRLLRETALVGQTSMQQRVEQDGLGQRVYWLIRLRWLAATAVAVGTFICVRILDVPLPEMPLYGIAALLLVYNAAVLVLLKYFTGRGCHHGTRRLKDVIDLQIAADLIILAILLHFSGGPENPLVFFFVFHAIIASILLSVWESYLQATLAVALLGLLLLLESTGSIQHHCLSGILKSCRYDEGAYLAGMFVTFAATMYLVVYMTSYIAVRLRRAEEAQKSANELLREKDRIKDEYVAHLTHDIKGHLAAIQSCLGVVVTSSLQGQAAEFVKRAYRRTHKLTTFVRTLLGLTRLKLDGKWEREVFSVPGAIQETIESVRLAVEEKSLHLECSIDRADAVVCGNEFSFKEAIINLLFNAVKYTPEHGTVSIRTDVQTRSVVIEVSDTGIGIPPAEQPRIFDEFYRASNARRVEPSGDGLGLALVKQVVELHGGTIDLFSKLGRGTMFRIVLPLVPSHSPERSHLVCLEQGRPSE